MNRPCKVSSEDWKKFRAKFELVEGQIYSLKYIISIKDVFHDRIDKKKQLTKVVLKEILRLNTSGREAPCVVCKEETSSETNSKISGLQAALMARADTHGPHPQDILLFSFKFSDLILRQSLCAKCFTCKLAIPFITPELPGIPAEISCFALQSIVLEYSPSGSQSEQVTEKSALSTQCDIVSFIRFNKSTSVSKSKILNDVLSRDSNVHHTFYTRNRPLGNSVREISNGLIELSWYLPSATDVDMFSNPTIFFNLRGDAVAFPERVEYLNKVSSCLVLSVNINDLGTLKFREVLKKLNHSKSARVKRIIILVNSWPGSNTVPDVEGSDILEWVPTFSIDGDHHKPINEEDLKINVRKIIINVLKKKKQITLKDAIHMGRDFVSFDNAGIVDVTKHVEKICASLKNNIATCKDKSFILQQNWEKVHKRKMELRDYKEDCDESNQLRRKIKKLKCEQQQALLEYQSRPLIKSVMEAIHDLANSETNQAANRISCFARSLGNRLDDKSRENLPTLHRSYRSTWNLFNEEKNKSPNSKRVEELKESLAIAAKKLMDESLGLEHIFREIGQMFAIAVSEGFGTFTDEVLKRTLPKFPDIVAQLMVDGFPLELMNGDSSSIQLTWVKAVFTSLEKLLKKQKIFVVSVLGVQSSGKSTLLNAMFGLQFAASAGRCTRGVFAQLIRVDKESNGNLPFDYIMVIDTEGLRATEVEDGIFKHDNEIATFVTGLGDVTIMNIKGENYSDIKDVIQISVHAFLRMKLVARDKRCDKSCIFVHQNVSAINATEKNMIGNHKLQESLDEAAKEAAQLENAAEIESFTQILDYDWKKHLYFVSGLWLGDPPMAPPNKGYSDKILTIKTDIYGMFTKEERLAGKTFPETKAVLTRMEDLWKGIQSDNFVFSFRNTLDIKAYAFLEVQINNLRVSLETFAYQAAVGVEAKFKESTPETDVDEMEKEVTLKMETDISEKAKEFAEEIDKYCQKQPNVYVMSMWKNKKDNVIKHVIDSVVGKIKTDILSLKNERNSVMGKYSDETFKKSVVQKVIDKAKKLSQRTMSLKQMEDEFNQIWETEWNTVPLAQKQDASQLVEEVEKILCSQFSTHEVDLKKLLKENPLLNRTQEGHKLKLIDTFTQVCIGPEDILDNRKRLTKFKTKLLQKGSDDLKGSAESVIRNIFREIDDEMTKLKTKNVRVLEKSHIMEVFNILSRIDKADNNYSISGPFLMKLAIHVYRYTIPIFDEIQNSKESCKLSILQAMKESLRISFEMVIQYRKAEPYLLCGILFLAPIIFCLKEKLNRWITFRIFEQNKSKCLVIKQVLEYLAEKDCFEEYCKYLDDPKGYTINWAASYVSDKYFIQTERSNPKFYHALMKKIDHLVSVVNKMIANSTLFDPSQQLLQDGIVSFCKQKPPNEKPLQILRELFWVDSTTKVTDLNKFKAFVLKKIGELNATLKLQFSNIQIENFRCQTKLIHHELIDRIWGCSEICPTCNEPCRHAADHSIMGEQHRCVGHRPQALKGTVVNSGDSARQSFNPKLHIWTCSMAKGKKEKRKSDYKMYAKQFPHWVIPQESEAIDYWKWVLVQNRTEFASHYSCATPDDIPTSWMKLSKTTALKSLEAYDSVI